VPALVGYLLAGIIIGPATPGFVADVHLASQLSEIGVMLLMFGVGLHFSLKDLLAVKRIAVPGAVVQMGLATALGAAMAVWWGWSWGGALIFGLSLSCASTVVLLKALEARGVLDSMNGRIAVGWLVVEDLATVFVLVLLPPLAGLLGGGAGAAVAEGRPLWATIGQTLLQVSAFIALMLVVGRRVLPWLLWQVAGTGSRELFTLAVIAAAIGIAYGAAQLFNVSFALGAFFAGMVMRESEFSHRAASESLPLRDASRCCSSSRSACCSSRHPVQAPATCWASSRSSCSASRWPRWPGAVFRYPLSTALTVSASLAQIGEFSFILAGSGCAGAAAARGHEPGAGRRADLDGAEPAAVRRDRAAAPLDPRALGAARRLELRGDRMPSCGAHRAQVPRGAGVLVG
jgi:CPA2 family monovalent cation:H+ antiporter-2